jgi:hypothetical protein
VTGTTALAAVNRAVLGAVGAVLVLRVVAAIARDGTA